jgi:hypothetical protein
MAHFVIVIIIIIISQLFNQQSPVYVFLVYFRLLLSRCQGYLKDQF